MNNQVSTSSAQSISILNRSKFTLFTSLSIVYLIFFAASTVIIMLSGTVYNFDFFGYSGFLNTYVAHSPVIYPFIFIMGISALLSSNTGFGSRKVFTIAAFMLMFGSVFIPLTQYFSPASMVIILALESMGASVGSVSLIYSTLQYSILVLLVILPISMIGIEIFTRQNRLLVYGSLILFTFSVFVYMTTVAYSTGLHNFISGIFVNSNYYDFLIAGDQDYLMLFAAILMIDAFLRHRVLVSQARQLTGNASP